MNVDDETPTITNTKKRNIIIGSVIAAVVVIALIIFFAVRSSAKPAPQASPSNPGTITAVPTETGTPDGKQRPLTDKEKAQGYPDQAASPYVQLPDKAQVLNASDYCGSINNFANFAKLSHMTGQDQTGKEWNKILDILTSGAEKISTIAHAMVQRYQQGLRY